MSGAHRRVELAGAYVLHHQPWRDTSRILEMFSRDHGRLTLFARGVRGPKSRSASLLQPFRMLLVSWSGGGEAGRLTQVEAPQGPALPAVLPGAALMSGWYLNELLIKLTVRNDPQPAVFDLYQETLGLLAAGGAVPPALRRFERRLLDLLGYGIDFTADARTGEALREDAYYHFHASLGCVEVSGEQGPGTLAGSSLLAIGMEDFRDLRTLDDARKVMRAALDHVLEGRELRTRAVALSLARSTGQLARGSISN